MQELEQEPQGFSIAARLAFELALLVVTLPLAIAFPWWLQYSNRTIAKVAIITEVAAIVLTFIAMTLFSRSVRRASRHARPPA